MSKRTNVSVTRHTKYIHIILESNKGKACVHACKYWQGQEGNKAKKACNLMVKGNGTTKSMLTGKILGTELVLDNSFRSPIFIKMTSVERITESKHQNRVKIESK